MLEGLAAYAEAYSLGHPQRIAHVAASGFAGTRPESHRDSCDQFA